MTIIRTNNLSHDQRCVCHFFSRGIRSLVGYIIIIRFNRDRECEVLVMVTGGQPQFDE